MLPHFFFDWWFAPWAFARADAQCLPLSADWLGQRDGYRLWCAELGVVADLPESLDPAWHVAAVESGEELCGAARLFAGLIAAREHNQQVLGELPFADRKWCVSIAATQPLRGAGTLPYAADDDITVRGLVELARRLEPGFPGIWSRLRLTLPAEVAARVDCLLEAALGPGRSIDASAIRAQRCWTLCRGRASTALRAAVAPATDGAAMMT